MSDATPAVSATQMEVSQENKDHGGLPKEKRWHGVSQQLNRAIEPEIVAGRVTTQNLSIACDQKPSWVLHRYGAELSKATADTLDQR